MLFFIFGSGNGLLFGGKALAELMVISWLLEQISKKCDPEYTICLQGNIWKKYLL